MLKEHGVKKTAGFIWPIRRNGGNTFYQQYSIFWLLNILPPSSGNSLTFLFTNCSVNILFKSIPRLNPGFLNDSYYIYFKINAHNGEHLDICGNESTMINDKINVALSDTALSRHRLPVSKEYIDQMMYYALY